MNQSLAPDIAAVMPQAVATGLFVSLATFQAPDGTLDAAGAPSGNFVNVSGLVNIPCMDAPMSEARLQATEVKAMDEIAASAIRHVLLNGFYPQLVGFPNAPDLGWRVIVDGIVWDLLGAEADSQSVMTRISMRLWNV